MKRVLILLDQHRRTILDCLAVTFLTAGVLAIAYAVWFLYPDDTSVKPRIPGADVIAASSIAVGVGGVILGLGGNRDDHEQRSREVRDGGSSDRSQPS